MAVVTVITMLFSMAAFADEPQSASSISLRIQKLKEDTAIESTYKDGLDIIKEMKHIDKFRGKIKQAFPSMSD